MVPFSIEIEWKEEAVCLLAEQLDALADEEGFIRFDIRDKTRRAVVFVCVEHQPPLPVTPQDLDTYYEALHYPEKAAAFSFDETFAKEEVECIGAAVRAHISAGNFSPAAQTQLL